MKHNGSIQTEFGLVRFSAEYAGAAGRERILFRVTVLAEGDGDEEKLFNIQAHEMVSIASADFAVFARGAVSSFCSGYMLGRIRGRAEKGSRIQKIVEDLMA